MKIAYCITCGNKFPKEALFCPYCGTKIYNPHDEDASVVDKAEMLREDPDINIDLPTEDCPAEEVVNIEPVVDPVVETSPKVSDIHIPEADIDLEKPLTGVCIISACFPMIGFIAALCNIGTNKRKAKVYALCALGGFTFAFLSGVIQAL